MPFCEPIKRQWSEERAELTLRAPPAGDSSKTTKGSDGGTVQGRNVAYLDIGVGLCQCSPVTQLEVAKARQIVSAGGLNNTEMND